MVQLVSVTILSPIYQHEMGSLKTKLKICVLKPNFVNDLIWAQSQYQKQMKQYIFLLID